MKQYTWAAVLIGVCIVLALAFGDKVHWISPITGSDHHLGLIWILINFAALVWVLEKLMFAKLRKKTADKHDHIKGELERATRARSEAESLAGEYRQRLDRLDSEAAELESAARERAEADRKRIIADAEVEAERIKTSAQAMAEREAQTRIREIEAEVVDRAVEKAETILRQKFSDADQQRVVETYVADVARQPLRRDPGAPS